MNDGTYYVKSSVGRFRVEKSASYNPNGTVKYHFLKVGGQKFCIEYRFSDTETVELQWIFTEKGGCEMNGVVIKGEKTIHLFYLRQYGNFKQIYFIDNSTFPCKLPNGEMEKIYMSKYYLLFHRKTWYEAKLNAYPKFPYDIAIYDRIKANFYDPAHKPAKFYFRNEDLEKILTPIYESYDTWAEFLDAVYTLPNLCQTIYPWHVFAIMEIKNNEPLPDEWIIDINESTPIIAFKRVSVGGTRKSRRLPEYKGELSNYIPSPEDIRNFKYL